MWQAQRGLRDLKDYKDRLGLQALTGLLGLPDLRAYRGRLDLQALTGLLAQRGLRDLKDYKDRLEQRVLTELLVLLDQRDPKDQLDQRALTGLLDLPDLRAYRDRLGHKDQLDRRDRRSHSFMQNYGSPHYIQSPYRGRLYHLNRGADLQHLIDLDDCKFKFRASKVRTN